jgi:hypothetical protein
MFSLNFQVYLEKRINFSTRVFIEYFALEKLNKRGYICRQIKT